MTAEAALVGETGNPDYHWIGGATVRKECKRRGFAANLIFGIVNIGEKLNLR